MKIEMGESLMLSWLRHAKNCKIAQLNWKISKNWDKYNEEEIDYIIKKINAHFPNVFKQNKPGQLLSQAEFDVLGLSFDENFQNNYWAIDIAFHENGLNYGDDVERISKKMFRSALVLYSQFNAKNGEIIFASPKINQVVLKPLVERINEINIFMKDLGFGYRFQLIANENFTQKILNKTIEYSSDVSDTSELFLRAFQLFDLGQKYQKQGNTNATKKVNNSPCPNEIKIGELVRVNLRDLFEKRLFSERDIKELKDAQYCKKTFNINYPLLIEKNQNREDEKGYTRYWAKIFDDKYYVCQEWFEYNRKPFEAWYSKFIAAHHQN